MTDIEKSPNVVIVNETLAQRFWPGENPVGKRLRTSNTSETALEVIGVARNEKYQSLSEIPALAIYCPMSQLYATSAALVVRTTTDAASTIATIRGEIRKLDPNLPLFDAKTLNEHIQLPLFPLHAAAVAMGSFALLATVLAAVGIYGVMILFGGTEESRDRDSHGVGGERNRRMATGAEARSDADHYRDGAWLGLICSAALSKVVANPLNGVSATDAQTIIVISVLLAADAMIACFRDAPQRWVPSQQLRACDRLENYSRG